MKKELGIFVLLLVLCAIGSVLNPQFHSVFNIQNQLQLIGMFGVFSLGMGLVIITGGIDLSVGSVMALQAIVLSILLNEKNLPWPVAVLASILMCVVIATVNGLLITRVRLQPFIVTLCGLLFYRSMARFVAGDTSKGFGTDDGYHGLKVFMKANYLGIPTSFWIFLIASVIVGVLLHRSVYGRYLYAVGRNEDAARYSGINTQRVVASAYVLLGVLTAISGLLFAFYTGSITPANDKQSYELYGVAAAVLGGCSLRGGEGSVVGIMLGTTLLVILRNLVNLLGIPSSLDFAVTGIVILIGVLADQIIKNRKPRVKIAA